MKRRGSAARQEQDKFHNRTGRMQGKLTDDAILRGYLSHLRFTSAGLLPRTESCRFIGDDFALSGF